MLPQSSSLRGRFNSWTIFGVTFFFADAGLQSLGAPYFLPPEGHLGSMPLFVYRRHRPTKLPNQDKLCAQAIHTRTQNLFHKNQNQNQRQLRRIFEPTTFFHHVRLGVLHLPPQGRRLTTASSATGLAAESPAMRWRGALYAQMTSVRSTYPVFFVLWKYAPLRCFFAYELATLKTDVRSIGPSKHRSRHFSRAINNRVTARRITGVDDCNTATEKIKT